MKEKSFLGQHLKQQECLLKCWCLLDGVLQIAQNCGFNLQLTSPRLLIFSVKHE